MSDLPATEPLAARIRALEEELVRRKANEASLRESRDRLFQILQETSIPTFVIDRDHRVTHVNKAFEALTGISAHEILGTRNQWKAFYRTERPTMADLIVDNVPEKELARFYKGRYQRSAFVEGGYQSERQFRDLKKGSRWLFFTASPLKDFS